MLGSSRFSFAVLLHLAVCFLACANALPVLLPRQGNSTTIQTTNTYESPSGPMTETCSITLTPMAPGPNGESVVQEVKSCSVAPASSSGSDSGSAGVSDPSASSPVNPSTPSAAESTMVVTTPSVVPTTPAMSVVGLTTVPASAVPTGASAATSAATSSPVAASHTASATNNNTSLSTPAAANAENAVVTPFALPGTKILVLPVGLIIFCTVTGIGLVVFSVVTFERSRYRKTFRKRRLAEQGAPMGWGGMA
ncbi:hypothetical protein BKA93DRAFT_747219 [Sparassis latifolia]